MIACGQQVYTIRLCEVGYVIEVSCLKCLHDTQQQCIWGVGWASTCTGKALQSSAQWCICFTGCTFSQSPSHVLWVLSLFACFTWESSTQDAWADDSEPNTSVGGQHRAHVPFLVVCGANSYFSSSFVRPVWGCFWFSVSRRPSQNPIKP